MTNSQTTNNSPAVFVVAAPDFEGGNERNISDHLYYALTNSP
jgi:hypothetical protein